MSEQDENLMPNEAPAPANAGAGKATPASRVVPGMDTLTAGREAAAFVASLFSEASTAENVTPVVDEDKALPTAQAAVEETVAEEEAPVSTNSLQGQHVLILGLGASGLAMARWCARLGAAVTVADTREVPPQLAVLKAALPQAGFIAGVFDATLVEGQGLADVRAVFKSPGLSPAQVEPVWKVAKARGLWTGGELGLFAHALKALKAERRYAPKVLAVTGTNGKTTTTSLTGLLVEESGKSVAVAGNIGPSLLDVLSEKLDSNALPEVWVLELSSFQLDEVQGFEPTAAVVLNVTQDHLDWHPDMNAYAAAKARVFGQQGLAVLNRDDAIVMALLQSAGKPKSAKAKPRDFISFGVDMPKRPGDYGLERVNGMVWLVKALEADETQKRKKDEEQELFIQRLIPAEALRIRGRHNATNALAALALAQAAGCPLGPLLYGLREYRGEPHRVEPIGIIRDVEYFDDSKGTNVGATVAALEGLGEAMNAGSDEGERDLVSASQGRRIVVILGGEGKGQDFSPLAEPVRRYVRSVILIGRDADIIQSVIDGSGVALSKALTMEDAVKQAGEQAQGGDAVLLSPACASFDMFKNYEHRSQVFVEAVKALADDAGVAL